MAEYFAVSEDKLKALPPEKLKELIANGADRPDLRPPDVADRLGSAGRPRDGQQAEARRT